VDLGAGFRRLWWATATSDAGSAIGYGALSIVAVLTLHASAAEVSLLAAVSALAGALIAVPSGALVEFRRKRPVMVAADIVRFAALASVAVATALHVVTMAQLYAVSVIQTAALVTFQSATGAHLRSLVPKENRAEAISRLDMSSWTANSLGPPIGGVLVTAVGPALTLAIDAVSYLASVLGVSRIRHPNRRRRPERPSAARRSSPAGDTCSAIGQCCCCSPTPCCSAPRYSWWCHWKPC
jgi:MFS family permease